MSQIRLTNAERAQAVERFGYAKREASFLCLAALHGGYFLRRQYCEFLGTKVGGTAAALIDKALTREHIRVATYRNNTHVFHINARHFYAAIGQEDNRNRRQRQPESIKAKLMALDFVLAHSENFLATEQEKVDYFRNALKVENDALPTKRYGHAGRFTDRYFVEKYPIFLQAPDQPAASPVASFCFIDGGAESVSGFRTFLDSYLPLFKSVRKWGVVYVAMNERLFQAAAKVFERFYEHFADSDSRPNASDLSARRRKHFEARRLFEAQQWSSFDRDGLIRFRNERQEFSGESCETLYRQWLAGAGVINASDAQNDSAALSPVRRVHEGMFSTYRIKSNYELFGKPII